MSKPKVLVVGSGGVGTICALGLSTVGKSEVTVVVRSDYDHVVKHGYTVDSVTYGHLYNWRPQNVARSVSEAAKEQGEYDYIVLTTKNIPDGAITCEDIIAPAVSAKTTIILVQNGIGIDVPMIKRFPENYIVSGVSLVGSAKVNSIVKNSHKDTLYVGLFKDQKLDEKLGIEKVKEFIRIYQTEQKYNEVFFDENVEKRRWEKLVYNSALNTTTSLVNLDINRCQINGANDSIFRPAMNEILKIAKSEGYSLSPELPELFIHIGDGLFYAPSMCVDMRKKQLLELEVILGNPLKVASRNKVETPYLSLLYNLLKMVQFRIKEEIGLVEVDESLYKGHNSDKYSELFQQQMNNK